ncbi:HCP-like protein [Calocera cornea HHB12733]|uniref:HCP-like protein n=1 Tax=Calocera cornea HHB12733 TaxID=1353952 RepID=A0A165DLX9_9BASI|nr:HCP-like protein [Calocera cornea HHB12733]
MASYTNSQPRGVRPPLPPPPPVLVGGGDPYALPGSSYKPRTDSLPPAIPPHPSNWSGEVESRFNDESLLRDDDGWAAQMASPKPQRLPGGATDAARRLEDTVTGSGSGYLTPSIRQGGDGLRPVSPYQTQNQAYYPGGFVTPGSSPGRARSPYASGLPSSPAPPSRMQPSSAIPSARLSSSASAGNISQMGQQRVPSGGDIPLSQQLQAMSLEVGAPYSQHRRSASSTTSANAPLIAALPTPETLQKEAPSDRTDPSTTLSWIQSVLLVSSLTPPTELTSQPSTGGPAIATIIPSALTLLQRIASSPSPPALAYHLRATLLSSGAYPSYFERNARSAFKDFEKAARAGYDPAWFRLGRDYESVGDLDRARDCFDRGARLNESSSLYRMGMANLLGQLNLPSNPQAALPLLVRAASQATLEVPQPPYVLGMILLNELPSVSNLPLALLQTAVPDVSVSLGQHALGLIQKSAFLHFPPAQYKLGYAYENAQLGLPYDPTLSVRYYSYASQGDELEADMALSKWFLCGAEGYFDKDEGLARTFAEKAARRGLASAEFAMGYYCEVGVGGPKNIEHSRKWYGKAAKHNNPDAPARLAALNTAQPEGLSRMDHESLTNSTLVRSRTLARERSQSEGKTASGGQKKEQEALAAAKRASLIRPSGFSQGGLAPVNEQELLDQPEDRRGSTATSLSSSSSATPSIPDATSPPPVSSRPATRQGRRGSPPRASPAPRQDSRAASSTAGSAPPTPGTPGQTTQIQSAAMPVQTAHGRGYSLSETILPAPRTPPSAPGTPGSAQTRKGPATFEEMGFYSQPLDQQKCVIM